MPPAPDAARVPADALRRARVAVSVLFFVNGALWAAIVPRLPAIKSHLDLSNSALGGALAFVGLGALAAGVAVARLIDRHGSARVAVVTGVVFAAALAGPALAPSWAVLAGCFAVLGACDNVVDVAMNAHGLRVQRGYGRSVLNSFHGWWSIGAATGATTGSLAAGADAPVVAHLALTGVVLAAAVLVVSRWLLPAAPQQGAAGPQAGTADAVDAGTPLRRRLLGRTAALRALGLLGLLAVMGAVAEDVPTSWTVLYLREVRGAAAGVAGAGFVAFTVGMTLGRFGNDALVQRWGSARVLRLGILASAAAVAVAALTPYVPLAIASFAIAGAGVSSLFPALFVAAGTHPGVPSAAGVALVALVARVGFTVSPVLVGTVSDAFGLGAGIGLGCLAALAVAALAGAVRPGRRAAT